jgi:hypothetical protein
MTAEVRDLHLLLDAISDRLFSQCCAGVGEPLDETDGGMSPYPNPVRSGNGIVVSGKHYLLLSTADGGVREVRETMDTVFSAPVVYYSEATDAASKNVAGHQVRTLYLFQLWLKC